MTLAAGLLPPGAARFVTAVPVVVIGAGACGLTAALAAHDAGAEVLVVERDRVPRGTTAMSTGLIPAAGTRFQRARGIDDTPARFAADILAKTEGHTDAGAVARLAGVSAATLEWLIDRHDVPLSLVDSFRYPGHSVCRMHGTPARTGSELIDALLTAIERAGVDVLCDAPVSQLFADPATGRVHGVRLMRPDGTAEDLACHALVLGCGGFAGDAGLIAQLIPTAVRAEVFSHPGNRGDALRWGRALGAGTADLGAWQGHGGLAAGRGVPLLWPLIMEGGIQVNVHGRRFSDESRGYSEQAADVLAQPGAFAWDIFDERVHELMLEFDDYRVALEAGAVVVASTVDALAAQTGIDASGLTATLAEMDAFARGLRRDPFGRTFSPQRRLVPPYRAAKVTGALFHTQGGLTVDGDARVLRTDGTPLPNLYAGGGAARGVSGPGAAGYLAGNGLLTATSYGRLAGAAAARQVVARA